MQIDQFKFIGLQNFGPIQEKIYKLIYIAFGGKENYEYQQALEEAVCNAAKYSIDGPYHARITIKVRRMAFDIAISVYAETHPFDAEDYQNRLKKLSQNPQFSSMDWGDYVATSPASSGFWYMLTGCDYVYIDSKGQSITLVAKTLGVNLDIERTTRIGELVPRFLVKKDGVIG